MHWPTFKYPMTRAPRNTKLVLDDAIVWAMSKKPDIVSLGPGLNMVTVSSVATELGLTVEETLTWLDSISIRVTDIAGTGYVWLSDISYRVWRDSRVENDGQSYEDYIDWLLKTAAVFAGLKRLVVGRVLAESVAPVRGVLQRHRPKYYARRSRVKKRFLDNTHEKAADE